MFGLKIPVLFTTRQDMSQGLLKGAPCSFIKSRNFNIYNINELIIQTLKYFYFPLLNKQGLLRGKLGPQNTV